MKAAPYLATNILRVSTPACPSPITGRSYLAVNALTAPNRIYAYLFLDGVYQSTLVSAFEHGFSNPSEYWLASASPIRVFTRHATGIGSWDVSAATFVFAPYPSSNYNNSTGALAVRGTTAFLVWRNDATNVIYTHSLTFGSTAEPTLLGSFDDLGGYESSSRFIVTNGALLLVRRRTSDNQAIATALPSGPAQLATVDGTTVRGGIQFGPVSLAGGGALIDYLTDASRAAKISDAAVITELWPSTWSTPNTVTNGLTSSPDGSELIVYDDLLDGNRRILRFRLSEAPAASSCTPPWISVGDGPLGKPRSMFALD